jgi:hypothetical protein
MTTPTRVFEPLPGAADGWRSITQTPTEAEHAWCQGRYLLLGESSGFLQVLNNTAQPRNWWVVGRGWTHYLLVPPEPGRTREGGAS